MVAANRPMSPHLQVYRPQITSVLSILHRMTGVFLTLGTLLLTYWLVAAGYGAETFESAQALVGSWLGHLLLWLFTFSLFYHLFNGIRHLLWDFGWGFELTQVKQSGYVMLGATVVLTVVTLIIAYS